MQKNSMKKAAIENVLIWIVLFTGFATLFFFIIDYATVLRVKDNLNAISDYGANYVAVNGRGEDISNHINANLKTDAIKSVSADTGVICQQVTNSPLDYKVIFTTEINTNSYKFYNNKISATRAVFNQLSGDTITCTLTVELK